MNSMQGKIIKNVSNMYTVLINNEERICHLKGKFRNMNIVPVVGDDVIVDDNDIVTDILPRRNELIRPYVSNVDQVFIICSVKKPDLDLYLLDKLLVILEFMRIRPIICFSKIDLLESRNDIAEYYEYYSKIGYTVYYNDELDKIKKCFKNKITVFTGQSGAGKSTLLNRLDDKLNIKTDDISNALGRGKHTTRHTELISLFGGFVADTPGFSQIEFKGMTNSDIRDNMVEFNLYRELCKYKDCMHVKEEHCEIKKHIASDILKTRYDNYKKFIGGSD